MVFDPDYLRFGTFCEAKSAKQQLFMFLVQYSEYLLRGDLYFILSMLIVPQLVLLAVLAVIIRVIQVFIPQKMN